MEGKDWIGLFVILAILGFGYAFFTSNYSWGEAVGLIKSVKTDETSQYEARKCIVQNGEAYCAEWYKSDATGKALR